MGDRPILAQSSLMSQASDVAVMTWLGLACKSRQKVLLPRMHLSLQWSWKGHACPDKGNVITVETVTNAVVTGGEARSRIMAERKEKAESAQEHD